VLAHRVRLRDPRAQADKFIREICLARISGINTDGINADAIKTDNIKNDGARVE
jgi:hypothetical protein